MELIFNAPAEKPSRLPIEIAEDSVNIVFSSPFVCVEVAVNQETLLIRIGSLNDSAADPDSAMKMRKGENRLADTLLN